MRIKDFIIHPGYYEDGRKYDFTKGNDLAFAVVEINNEEYRRFQMTTQQD